MVLALQNLELVAQDDHDLLRGWVDFLNCGIAKITYVPPEEREENY